jgi:surface antigen
MTRLRLLLAAATIAMAVLPARVPPALADSTTTGQQLAQLNDQLTAEQAQLNALNDQVERAQADVDQLDRRLQADQQRETQLDRQLVTMGRLEYEQPMFSLSTILEARSLQQLFSNIAQARLVASRQRSLLGQAHQLRRQDQQTHDQVSARLAQVQAARDQAAQVAAKTLALRNATQDAALAARAGAVNAQATATQKVTFSGSGPYPNHFTFGYCTWYVATRRYVPWFGNAIDWWPNAPPYGYAEGQTPRVGSIMVTRESGFGHVAYVESVSGNQFTVSEMNYTAWDVVDRRTITLGGPVPIVGFIY